MTTEGIIGTREEQVTAVVIARTERARARALRRLHVLCEDADELLGRVAEAARFGSAEAAIEPLAEVRQVAISIVHALRRAVPPGRCRVERVDALDEDEVLATLALLEELDAQLRDARAGHRGAGWRAGRLAARLIAAVNQLTAAAASGRTRAHAAGTAAEVA